MRYYDEYEEIIYVVEQQIAKRHETENNEGV